VSFLRRILGGGSGGEHGDAGGDAPPAGEASGEDEAERDRRLLREESQRLDDELIQRQLRYADRSWVPTAQGGSRRADDPEGEEQEA
jgi:hypothetical protein